MKIPELKQIMQDGEHVVGITTNLILEETEPSQRAVITTEKLERCMARRYHRKKSV